MSHVTSMIRVRDSQCKYNICCNSYNIRIVSAFYSSECRTKKCWKANVSLKWRIRNMSAQPPLGILHEWKSSNHCYYHDIGWDGCHYLKKKKTIFILSIEMLMSGIRWSIMFVRICTVMKKINIRNWNRSCKTLQGIHLDKSERYDKIG